MTEITTTTLRLPSELLEIIRVLAQDQGRSLNAQIVWLLREMLKNLESQT